MIEYKSAADLTAEDRDLMAVLAEEFHKESHQGQFTTYSAENFKNTIKTYQSAMLGFAAFDKGACVGFIIFNINKDYTEEYIAELAIMYIREDYRKFEVVNELMERCDTRMKYLGAAGAYIESTAGFDDGGKNARAFRMWGRRFGYFPIGEVKSSLYKKVLTEDNESATVSKS